MFYVEIKNEKEDREKQKLKSTFYGKCYICEDDASKDGEKEHRIPVSADKSDVSLKKSSNLFWACRRCNSIKLDGYYDFSDECKHTKGYCGIIDCTKCDPNEYISITASQDLKIEININAKKYAPCIKNTVSLLRDVYCPNERMDTTKLAALKERIIYELAELDIKLDLLFNAYQVSPEKPKWKIDRLKREIIDLASPETPFFAIKLSRIEKVYNQHHDSGFDKIIEEILKVLVPSCCG